jgi:putative ABC transport system substrate-binding protein
MSMKRRNFLGVLGSAVTWPLAARAQQPDKIRHVGVLIGLASSTDDPVAKETLQQFRGAMQEAGWIDGKNVRFDYRFGGDVAKINASVTELVTLSPEVIYATGFPAVRALHQKTQTIPIVFTQVADPVGFGLVEKLGYPGGNVTGFIVWDLSIGGKWIQLLREIAPDLTRIGIIYNPDTAPYAPPLIASAKAAAGSSVAIIECPTRDDKEIEAAASSLAQEPHGGLLIVPEPFTNTHRDQIIAQAARFNLPTLNSVSGAADRGALLSYTYAFNAMIRQPVSYIDRILKGAKPADLPVQAPTKYELIVNLKTAKTLGLTVPSSMLVAADKVIE